MKTLLMICLIGTTFISAEQFNQVSILEDVIRSYSRSVTVLGLSNLGENRLQELAQSYPSSVFVTKTNSTLIVEQSNRIAFLNDLAQIDVQTLGNFEHFDIAYYFGDCQYKQKMIQALLTLADHVLLELPEDLYDLMNNFFYKNDAKILSHHQEHFLILLKRKKPKAFRPHWKDQKNAVLPIMTSHHYALLKSSKHTQILQPGLSLYGYKILRGFYPDIEQLSKAILAYPWKHQSACLPWNIVLQGAKIHWMERFKEPRAWSKEGIAYTLKGLKIQDTQKFKAYALNHLKNIGIEK